jgi:hypothetical protein
MSSVMFFVLIGWIQSASADVCVEIDKNKDMLTKQQKKAAYGTLTGAFEEHGLKVVEQDCEETYTNYNIKLGDSMMVYLTDGKKTKKMQIDSLSELPEVHDQLVRMVALGQQDPRRRDNITRTQTDHQRVQSDSSLTFRLGYGSLFEQDAAGPRLGLGFRFGFDEYALDISLLDYTLNSSGDTDTIHSEILGLGGHYYFSPLSDTSLYTGGKFGLTRTTVPTDSSSTEGSRMGLSVSGVAGVETFRTADVTGFGELKVSMPTYQVNGRIRPFGSVVMGIGF